jgi:hypothetical protein
MAADDTTMIITTVIIAGVGLSGYWRALLCFHAKTGPG